MERQEQALDDHPAMAGMGIAVLFAALVLSVGGVALIALAVAASEKSVAIRLGVGGAGAALLALVGGVLWSLRQSEWGRDTLHLCAAGLVVGAVCLVASPLVLRAGGWARAVTGLDPSRLVRAVLAFGLPLAWRIGRRPEDHAPSIAVPALLAWPVAFALAAALESPATPRSALLLPLLYALFAVGAASTLAALRRWLAAAGVLVVYGFLALASIDGREREVVATLILVGIAVWAVRRVLARRRGPVDTAA